MPARVWHALAGLIVLLLAAVVGLDQWQARRGEASLFRVSWPSRGSAAPPPRAESRRPSLAEPTPSSARGGPPGAAIGDEMGGRGAGVGSFGGLARPGTPALLPGLALSPSLARGPSR